MMFLMNLTIFFASGDGWFLPFIAGPFVGTAFYGAVYLYYRNTNKRHTFEHETSCTMTKLQARDGKIGENNGTRERDVRGRNSEDHLQRVNRV